MNSRIFLPVLLWGCWVPDAAAYVDPGNSLLFLQGFFALIGAILYWARNPVSALKSLVNRIKRR